VSDRSVLYEFPAASREFLVSLSCEDLLWISVFLRRVAGPVNFLAFADLILKIDAYYQERTLTLSSQFSFSP